MTEKEKMLGGEFYDTRDIELRTLSNRGKDLMKIYNSLLKMQICESKFFSCCLVSAVKMPVSISRFG